MKKMMAVLLVVMLGTMVLFTGCGGGGDSKPEGESLTISYNTSVSGDLYESMNSTFKAKVEELSGGTITVNLIPSGTMGTAREVVESVQLNSLNMAEVADSEINQVVGNMAWAFLPGMFSTYEEADEVYNGGWIYDELSKIAGKSGIQFIASTENGFRGVAAGKGIIDSMDKLAGKKVRVPEQQHLIDFYSACKALPVTISANESFTAMQQGTCDASDNTLQNLYNLGFFDIMSSVTMLNYTYDSGKIVANKDWWEGLTDEQRSIITQAGEEAGMVKRNQIRDSEEELIAKAEEKNVAVIIPDDAFVKAIKKVSSEIWEKSKGVYIVDGVDYVEMMFEKFGRE